VLLAGRDRFVSSYSRTSKASDPSAVASQGQTKVNQQRVQGQEKESDRERFMQEMGETTRCLKRSKHSLEESVDNTERKKPLLFKASFGIAPIAR
jgi:hypothetical protein